MNTSIINAIRSSTPTKSYISKHEYPHYILNKIIEKRRLRRVWQTHRTPDDKRKLNNATRKLTKIIKKFKNDCFQKYLVNLSPSADSNYSLWKASRKLTRPPPPNNPTNSLSARRMGTKPYGKGQPLRQLPFSFFFFFFYLLKFTICPILTFGGIF